MGRTMNEEVDRTTVPFDGLWLDKTLLAACMSQMTETTSDDFRTSDLQAFQDLVNADAVPVDLHRRRRWTARFALAALGLPPAMRDILRGALASREYIGRAVQ